MYHFGWYKYINNEYEENKISEVNGFKEVAVMEKNSYETVKNVPLWKYVQRMRGRGLISQSKGTIRGR